MQLEVLQNNSGLVICQRVTLWKFTQPLRILACSLSNEVPLQNVRQGRTLSDIDDCRANSKRLAHNTIMN